MVNKNGVCLWWQMVNREFREIQNPANTIESEFNAWQEFYGNSKTRQTHWRVNSTFPGKHIREWVRFKNKMGDWKSSKAKKELQKALQSGQIPLSSDKMRPQDVYLSNPEFAAFDYKCFSSNLWWLHQHIAEGQRQYSEALAHDCHIYPKMEIRSNGKYRWEGSQAEHFLREDMAKVDTDKDSMDLYKSRQEYYNYFLKKILSGSFDKKMIVVSFLLSMELKRKTWRRKSRSASQIWIWYITLLWLMQQK